MFTAAEGEEISRVKDLLLLDISNIMNSEKYSTDLMSYIVNYGILTGGASASMFHKEQPNDYDIFIEDTDTIGHIERYLAKHPEFIKDVKEGYFVKDSQMEGKVWSSRAITLKGNIQLIIMNTASQRIQFDFEHCKPWLHLRTRKYFISEEQYRSIKSKTLLPTVHQQPAPHRIFKFEERGWKMSDRVQRNPFVSPIPVKNIPVPPDRNQAILDEDLADIPF